MRTPTAEELRALIQEQKVARRVWLAMVAAFSRKKERAADVAVWHREARKASLIEQALRQWLGRLGGRS